MLGVLWWCPVSKHRAIFGFKTSPLTLRAMHKRNHKCSLSKIDPKLSCRQDGALITMMESGSSETAASSRVRELRPRRRGRRAGGSAPKRAQRIVAARVLWSARPRRARRPRPRRRRHFGGSSCSLGRPSSDRVRQLGAPAATTAARSRVARVARRSASLSAGATAARRGTHSEAHLERVQLAGPHRPAVRGAAARAERLAAEVQQQLSRRPVRRRTHQLRRQRPRHGARARGVAARPPLLGPATR